MTKSFDELHTEIAQCVSALQYTMYKTPKSRAVI